MPSIACSEPHSGSSPTPVAASSPKRRRRRVLWALVGLAAIGAAGGLHHLLFPRNYDATGEMLRLDLPGGPQLVPYYCHTRYPRGIVIVGTGDGGWSYWEENVARHLAAKGYAVGGWDCRKFADSRRYDQAGLADGYARAVEAVRERSGADDDAPVWYGGWSTGAEQAVAAAAKDAPETLRGLWLAGPGERGRFGLTVGDLLGQTPTGPDSFSLAEMGTRLHGIPLVQFEAGLDPLDDTKLVDGYAGPKRVVRLPGLLHDMGGAGERFQGELDRALEWTLSQKT